MSNRTLASGIVLALFWITGWQAWEYFKEPREVSDLFVGEFVMLPFFLTGVCVHLVVFHGSCGGCERFVRGRERAIWLSYDQHPRDWRFPNVVYSPSLYRSLQVNAIPAEFVIRASGRVAYVGNPVSETPPTCAQLGERS